MKKHQQEDIHPCHQSIHQIANLRKDEYDSQQEMDTIGELRGTIGRSKITKIMITMMLTAPIAVKRKGEAESLSEIEECYLKSLDEKTEGCSEENAGYLQEEDLLAPKVAQAAKWNLLHHLLISKLKIHAQVPRMKRS